MRKWRAAHPESRLKEGRQDRLKHKDKRNATRRRWRKESDTSRNYDLRTKYGITLDEYKERVERQYGLCAICQQPETRPSRSGRKGLAVDHDHTTNKVRELLCWRCNVALGMVEDNPLLLTAMIDYLFKHSEGKITDAIETANLTKEPING